MIQQDKQDVHLISKPRCTKILHYAQNEQIPMKSFTYSNAIPLGPSGMAFVYRVYYCNLLYKNLFAFDDVNAFAWSFDLSTLQIVNSFYI